MLSPKIINFRAVLKRGVGLLHHLNFHTEIEDLCETARCPQTQGQDFPVCALWLSAAVGLDTYSSKAPSVHGLGGREEHPDMPPATHFCKEGLWIRRTGRSMGWELQLYSLPAGRGFPRPVMWFCARGSSKSSSVEGSLVGWDSAPSPLWHSHHWVLLSQTLSWELLLLGQGQPQLGPALWQGFAACLPAVLIVALMCVTRDGVSLSACWVFSVSVSLCLIPVLGCSCSPALCYFPSAFPSILAVSS